MAKGDITIVPIIFQRLHDDFGDVDWVIWLNGPFELTNPIQTMQMEAGQKGMAVIVQATLVPSESLLLPDDELDAIGELEKELKDTQEEE